MKITITSECEVKDKKVTTNGWAVVITGDANDGITFDASAMLKAVTDDLHNAREQ